jgi:exosortase
VVDSRSETAIRAALAWTLGLTIVVVYAGTLSGLAREWTSSPDASYGVVLVAVALTVAWRRRADLSRACSTPSSGRAGFPLLIAGLLIYLVGQLGADVFLTRVSFVVVLAGALWFVAGARSARLCAAPLIFLLMAVPLPALVVNAVTLPLQLTASRIAEHTLGAVGVAVFRDGNVLELPSGSLEVAEACSGLRSVVSLAAIGVLLAWSERSWPRRAVMVVACVPVAIVMNGLRISATALACEAWGADAATGSWHTFTGWVTFVASVAILVTLQRAFARSAAERAAWAAAVSA